MLKTDIAGEKKKATRKNASFPIVAIGASSGGLEAVTELLQNLPPDTGMAFIFIQHLSPDYKSILVSLLKRSTKMAVQEIEDMERMEPNNLYVIPYNKGIEVTDGHIQLTPRLKNGPAMSIDILFTSLAETHKEDAIGVVLSGNASDGTQGLKMIKQEGGSRLRRTILPGTAACRSPRLMRVLLTLYFRLLRSRSNWAALQNILSPGISRQKHWVGMQLKTTAVT